MAQYQYVATNKDGESVQGSLEAGSESELRVALRSQNLRPTKINKAGSLTSMSGLNIFRVRVSDAEVLLFTRQLAILINSGIPLVQGLEIIGGQVSSSKMRDIVSSIKDRVSSGSFLWESLKSYPEAFSSLYVSMVKAGESSGALDTILKRLMRYLEDIIKLKKLVKGAMVYPIAVVSIGVGVILVMLTFVIPKFEEMLLSSGQELPQLTQMVIDSSHFCSRNIGVILGGMIGIVILTRRYLETDEGRNFFDSLILNLPFIGNMALKVYVARFSRTMQTMLSSGINLLDSIEICKGAVGNRTFSAQLAKVRSEVESGKSMAVVLSKNSLFPSMMVQMVTVGETTGNLDQMLERVADYYEEEVTEIVSNLTKMIEPFILVGLGGMVAGLMIAMYLPIFKMAG